MPLDRLIYTGNLSGESRPGARDALDELFTHSDGLTDDFSGELAALGIGLPKPPIRVVTVNPGIGDAPFSMAQADHFFSEMERLLPEYLGTDGVFYYNSGRVQGVVTAPHDVQKIYQSLGGLLDTFPPKQRPHIALSAEYPGMDGISRACFENQEAHLYERFLSGHLDILLQPQDCYLRGEEPKELDSDLYFGQISQKISNAMGMGDRERVHRILDEVLTDIVGRFPKVSAVHIQAVHFCQPLELTLVGADLIDRLFIQQSHLIREILSSENEGQLRELFHRELDDIFDYSVQRKELHDAKLMHRVIEYIEGNLFDSMLSLPNIAENFGVSEAKLSARFREYYQETIPNLIHQRRVEWIREQLRSTSRPVREIALDAGYISIATMNRVFLRLEGISPGQYRQRFRTTHHK